MASRSFTPSASNLSLEPTSTSLPHSGFSFPSPPRLYDPLAISHHAIWRYNFAVEFEWDEAKRHSNFGKHGLDFADAAVVFAGLTYTFEDDREDYGETRHITFGMLDGRAVVMVHTERGDKIRIISMRKALKYEAEIYFSEIGFGSEEN